MSAKPFDVQTISPDELAEEAAHNEEKAQPETRRMGSFIRWFVIIVLILSLIPIGIAGARSLGLIDIPNPLGFLANHSLLHPGSAARDAGGYAGDYDYGGWDDWGGSSYDWDDDYSYSWDWDDDDDYSWSWSWDDDDDYSYSYSYDYDDDYRPSYTYSSDALSDTVIDAIVSLIIFIAIVRYISNILNGGSRRGRTTPPKSTNWRKPTTSNRPEGAARTPESKLRKVSTLQKRDPLFDASVIETRIANVYVQMQNAWTAGDFSPMRPYFSNALFAQFERQLAELRSKGRTNYVENIAVLESLVRGWYESEGSEYLVMRVRTRIVDYVLDDRTGQVVGGSRTNEVFLEYEYILQRPVGTQTVMQKAQIDVFECPNCGAPVDIAQSAKCPYCGSILESSRHTWVISAIKGVAQRTQR